MGKKKVQFVIEIDLVDGFIDAVGMDRIKDDVIDGIDKRFDELQYVEYGNKTYGDVSLIKTIHEKDDFIDREVE